MTRAYSFMTLMGYYSICQPFVVASGVALGEASRLLSVEKQEKRTQRRLLHDEIHTLRQEV